MSRVNGLYMNDKATKQELGELLEEMVGRDTPVDFREEYELAERIDKTAAPIRKWKMLRGCRKAGMAYGKAKS